MSKSKTVFNDLPRGVTSPFLVLFDKKQRFKCGSFASNIKRFPLRSTLGKNIPLTDIGLATISTTLHIGKFGQACHWSFTAVAPYLQNINSLFVLCSAIVKLSELKRRHSGKFLGPRGPLRTPLVSRCPLSALKIHATSHFLFLQTLSSSNLFHSIQNIEQDQFADLSSPIWSCYFFTLSRELLKNEQDIILGGLGNTSQGKNF